MNNVVQFKEDLTIKILRYLKKLAEYVPKNAPDFQDIAIARAYYAICHSFTHEQIIKAFTRAKQLEFFPSKTDFQEIFDNVVEEEREQLFSEAHKKAEKAAECIFEIAMSGRYYSCFRDEKAKFCLSDLDFYWVELNFQSIDELFAHFQNEKFRQKNKKEMFAEIKSIFERAQTDDDFRQRTAEFSKTKKESYRIKASGEKTDWLQVAIDCNSHLPCERTRSLMNRVVKEVDDLCKNFKSDFSYDYQGNIWRKEENGFVFFKKVLQEVEVSKENVFMGKEPAEIVRNLCEKMKL